MEANHQAESLLGLGARCQMIILDRLLGGQRHFGIDCREYKHDAPASVSERKSFTRWRFVLVWAPKVALSK